MSNCEHDWDYHMTHSSDGEEGWRECVICQQREERIWLVTNPQSNPPEDSSWLTFESS